MGTKMSSKVSLVIAIVLIIAALINYLMIQKSKEQLQTEYPQAINQMVASPVESLPSFIKKRRPTVESETVAPDWPKPIAAEIQSSEEKVPEITEPPPDM
jgi:cytoskeletal protein RodZ